MTVWHVVLYAVAALLALRSFIQLAEQQTAGGAIRPVSRAVGRSRKAA